MWLEEGIKSSKGDNSRQGYDSVSDEDNDGDGVPGRRYQLQHCTLEISTHGCRTKHVTEKLREPDHGHLQM